MAVEVRAFSPTVPAGTPASAGWSSDMSFPARVVEGIDIKVPPGPRGNVGFYIGSAGTPIIPVNAGEYIVTDNESISYDLEDMITSGSWTFYAYNNGVKAHTVYVRFRLLVPYGPAPATGATLIAASALTFGSD